MLTTAQIRTVVHRVITELVEDDEAEPRPVVDGDRLTELGFSSLALARLIIQLETEFGVDPFAQDLVISDVRTVDELITAYHNAVSAAATAS
ncbi:MAG TPA: phosphopantetheine-binding protein [Pseudonocardiaceae bacterium]|jgi:acyl carrier protein|nr:phosphopantetheine-binding protein [Pseudonocardiaceae bacterium]